VSDKIVSRLCEQTRQNLAQAFVNAPDGWFMTLQPPTRTLDQNAMLHGTFGAIAKQATWHGRRLNPVQWKTLMISAHAIATGLGSDMVPGLEGEWVNIRESSAQMGVSRMSSLIEYVVAWCANNNIKLPAPKGYENM